MNGLCNLVSITQIVCQGVKYWKLRVTLRPEIDILVQQWNFELK